MAKEKLKTKRGITLIALVITIIVMLILVAATVTVALNGGLFQSAKKATADTEVARVEESELSNGKVNIDNTIYNSIDEYLGTASGGGSGIKTPHEGTYDNIAKNPDGTLTDNATYTEGEKTAVIPKGFKISGVESEQKINDGLVIQDSEGNEFVWIPVEVPDGKNIDDVFYRSDWLENGRGSTKYTTTSGSSFNEPLESGGYNGEKDEYNAMKASVQKNGGFYIGRYEAGSVDNEGKPKQRTSSSAGEGKIVVKKDQYPYNFVVWGKSMTDIDSSYNSSGYGAVKLSKDLYAGNDNVVSTLCYGVQWDAMLDFIKDEKNLKDSTEWGNYYNNEWKITNENASYSDNQGASWKTFSGEGNTKTKNNSESILLTTGASNEFAAKNIYDIAGNCYEWTMEANSSYNRVIRGRLLQRQWL